MGALCSLIFITISMIFLYSKIMVLINVSRIIIMSNYQVGALTYNDKFSGDDGLYVAAALTKYDSDPEPITDPRYGEMIIEYYGWGYEGELESKKTPIETHSCSDEELGIADDVEYPIFKTSATEVSLWKKKFLCADKKDLIIYGDYNSAKAQTISIRFLFCDSSKNDYCFSREETIEWLQHKYIILLYRQSRFDPDSFYEDTKIKETRI